ncbi:hypothetical protein FJZ53_03945 [Candidatus Woesearchaeota archaeon]|nr:hypothetical protein [Candidatus Woesearchaeota archaeon]
MRKREITLLALITFLALCTFSALAQEQNETVSCENATEGENCTQTAPECKPLGQTCSKDDDCCTELVCLEKACKTMPAPKPNLTDCNAPCANENGCLCDSKCVTTSQVVKGQTCSGEKKIASKEVGLCDGCIMDGTCLKVGDQKRSLKADAMYYCGPEKRLETVKLEGDSCTENYECINFNCLSGVCASLGKEEETGSGLGMKLILVIFAAVIVLGGLAFLLRNSIKIKPSQKAEEPKKETQKFKFTEEINPAQSRYKYRPEFDALEKKMKDSLGRIGK